MPLLVAGYVFTTLDPWSAALLLGTAPLIPVMMVLVGSYAEEHTRRQWAALSRLGAHFLDALTGLPTLKAFGRADDEKERVARVGEEFRVRTMKVLLFAFLNGLVLEFMTSAVPLNADGDFFLPLWTNFSPFSETPGVLDWYTVLIGVLALVTLVVHGANWFAVKTEGEVNARSRRISRVFSVALVVLTALATPLTFWVSPWMLEGFNERPYGYVLPLVAIAGLAGLIYAGLKRRDTVAFLSSSAYTIGMLTSTVFAVYPNVLPAVDPANSLTIQNAASSDYSQAVGLVWWSIGMVLAAVYFVVIYRLFRGKVRLEDEGY